MSARVLVTGASGFIGARVVRRLLAEGCTVAALAKPGDPLSRLQDIEGQIEVLRGELREFAKQGCASLSAFAPDCCIHLAWYAEPGRYLNAVENLSSLSGSLELIDALLACGCRELVGAGTCAEYAHQARPLIESDPVQPATLYASSKLSLALVGERLAAGGGFRFAWGRIFFLYGPGEDPRRMMPALIQSLTDGRPFAASAGTQVRDYLHVDDVAGAFVRLALDRASGIYNICSGSPITVQDLMRTVGRMLGREELIHFGKAALHSWDPPYICGDNARLRSLGWTPRYRLEQGLKDTIEYSRSVGR